MLERGRTRPDGRVHAEEIGTYLGETALQLLRAVPFLNLLMVDPFDAVEPYADGAYDSGAYPDAASAYTVVHDALASFRNRSVILKQPSRLAGDLVRRSFFDVVIVDGDHSYEGCSTDVATWIPRLRRDSFPGVMVFHDYSTEFPGTIRCIHEAAASHAEGHRLWLGPEFTAWFYVGTRDANASERIA
eukprot:TRINITY_DN47001_c0_g1_i1.p1 TRINITY_DN47001_c0_g1~~TRINITY_DN47001_c0_g1_i1.p1  ORF type:complete len:188 (-),score=11.61 TRINITY_DN47001_c0_g1_i1:23-586(-)